MDSVDVCCVAGWFTVSGAAVFSCLNEVFDALESFDTFSGIGRLTVFFEFSEFTVTICIDPFQILTE